MALALIDSHTHLDSKEFDTDRDAVIQRAVDAGVTRLVTIGAGSGGLNSAERAVVLAEKHSFVWASAGVHPHDASLPFDISRLKELALHPKVVAVGETGLDFFKEWSPPDAQRTWFVAQIKLAREIKKPLIIHSRQAGEECLKTLIENNASEVGGVFHCFAENAQFAAELRKINFLVSFPGTVTFKNAASVKEAARDIPLDQILVETDAPYMAPVPHRGKRCESAFMVETARAIAELKGISLDEVARVTSENALRLYKIPVEQS